MWAVGTSSLSGPSRERAVGPPKTHEAAHSQQIGPSCGRRHSRLNEGERSLPKVFHKVM